VLLLN
jgi:hypothetical protein